MTGTNSVSMNLKADVENTKDEKENYKEEYSFLIMLICSEFVKYFLLQKSIPEKEI